MADRVAVGMNVDIKRSDGRVHGAVISEVKRETGSVTVEWFERGETKGKEIDIASLIAINPLLAAKDPPITKPQSILTQSVLPTSSTNLLAMNDENDDLFELPSVLAPGAKAGAGRQSLVAPTTKSSSAPRRAPTAAAAPAPQTMISSQNANTNSAPVARRTITAQNGENGNGYAPPSISARSAGIPPPSVRNSITSTAATTPATSAPTGIVPPKTARVSTVQSTPSLVDLTSPELESGNDTILIDEPKKSSTVQEIERLEKQRAERRAQQNSVKKQRELDKAIDPGNPNWQFLAMIREYQSQIDYRPLKMSDQVIDSRISVCVRKRPLNKKEINRREIEVITIPNRDHIIVHQPQTKVDLTKYLENQKFRFDYAFDENTSNEMVYKFTAQPLVRTIFEGGFATCFAYGQTGSGKTHTMGGDFSGKVQDCTKGIYALTASDVFKSLQKEYRNQGLSVGCSFFEIYGGKVFDLLSNKAMLRVLEDGKKEVNVVGLKEEHVACEKDVLDLIKRGTDVRTAGTTSANANSSRSHAVFQIVLRAKSKKLYGKFSLIDLAGNERGVDTISSDRQTRLEGAEINKSLLALKECIRAMAKNSNHVPFRASKLTLVLRDSFVGENAKTCMIAMISPGMCSCEHTLNTLRYADRVKELGFDEGGGTTPMNDEDFMLPNEDDDPQAAQQRAVAEVMECENNMLDKQCDHINQLHQAASELQEIYQTATGNVDYDMEAYVKDSIKFYEKQIQNLTDGLEAARYWQEAMDREASATQQLNRQLAGKKK